MSAAPKPRPDVTDEEYEALLRRAEAFGLHKPDPVPPDQEWFWTPDWLAGEIEASEDIAAGRVYSQDSDEEFIAFLTAWAKRANSRRG
jgi:antitoxin PrlF